MNEEETKFESGESAAEVVKVGDTVRRSLGENSDRVHKIYKALESAGFDLSPKFLGIDEKNREIISLIPGKNISNPTLQIAKEAVKALRRFHDILAATELKETSETICHRDFAPWNVLESGGHVVGIIDFDDSYPGRRITDLVYACWVFLDLGKENSSKSNEEQISNIKVLVEAYGPIDVSDFIAEMLSEQRRILKYRKERMEKAEGEKERKERENIYNNILQQINWIETNSKLITEALNN